MDRTVTGVAITGNVPNIEEKEEEKVGDAESDGKVRRRQFDGTRVLDI